MPSRIDQIRLLNVMQIEEEKRLLRSLDDFFRLSMSGRDRRAGREEERKIFSSDCETRRDLLAQLMSRSPALFHHIVRRFQGMWICVVASRQLRFWPTLESPVIHEEHFCTWWPIVRRLLGNIFMVSTGFEQWEFLGIEIAHNVTRLEMGSDKLV